MEIGILSISTLGHSISDKFQFLLFMWYTLTHLIINYKTCMFGFYFNNMYVGFVILWDSTRHVRFPLGFFEATLLYLYKG